MFFLIEFMNSSFASEYNAIVLPNSILKKSDSSVLYSKNLEEIFANNLVAKFSLVKKLNSPSISNITKTLSSNPQLNSGIETEDKSVILAKIYGVNKIINIFVKYEINSSNQQIDIKSMEKNAMITHHATIRLITEVRMQNLSDNKIIWSNIFYKNINFDEISNKNIEIITNYYDKLSSQILEEIKTQSGIKSVDYTKAQEIISPEMPKKEVVEIKHTPVNLSPTTQSSNTRIKPMLELKENIDIDTAKNKSKKLDLFKKKTKSENFVKKQEPSLTEKMKSKLENIPIKLKSSNPEGVGEEPKSINSQPEIQQQYSDIQLKPRQNSRNYKPQFDSSVNEF
jgi:hypothetical protein